MPIGNGDIGLNVWAEEDGDLLFYIAKNDSWSENGRLLKLGRVRVHLTPNPFIKGLPFKQELKLRQGEMIIQAGEVDSEITIRVWVDANNPVVQVEAESRKKFEMQVNFETWRETGYKLESTTVSDMLNFDNHTTTTPVEYDPYPTIVYPDVIMPGKEDRIVWYHHNVKSLVELIMNVQNLEHYYSQMTDPLLYHTFGGAIEGDGFVSVVNSGEFNGPHPSYKTKIQAYSDRSLKSIEANYHHRFQVYALVKQSSTVPEYITEFDQMIDDINSVNIDEARKAHYDWWENFWNRSWIHVNGKDAEEVSKSYALQRFILACNSRGKYPIKFNGYNFTFPAPEVNHDPDFRRSGPGFWFMNTRALYWPMITSGDFELMEPFFRLYMNALPMARERTKTYYGHDGAYIPEQIYFWGGYLTCHYGWDRTDMDPSFVEVKWTKRLWQGSLELLLMMYDYYTHTLDDEFLENKLLVMADEIITFYDLHYSRNDQGKLYIWPSQSLEAWWDCVNPIPEVAGLRSVLAKLLILPENYASPEQRRKWERILSELPDLPTRILEDGKKILAPAEKFDIKANRENSELYAVFPYRLYGVGRQGSEIAQLTYENPFPDHFDNGVYVSFLGLVDEARKYAVEWSHPPEMTTNWNRIPIRFKHLNMENFPLAYMSLLQSMLIQYDGDKILLFPTWPSEWDVDFKLHAPYKTTVEGSFRDGKIENLNVTPASRTKDVVYMQTK